ncbi:MAG TPA: hypothetical protein VHZ50_16355 [Puia sp.]|jgi:hypothetical protein|nr:hypothetical protein [Puia sp.]
MKEHKGHHMKEHRGQMKDAAESHRGKMAHKGYEQGNMSPEVEDCQRPRSNYAEQDFSKTTSYVERHNKFEGREAADIRKQDYKGRYS